MNSLRQFLDSISGKGGGEHWQAVRSVRERYGHSIQVNELIERSEDWGDRQYNCYMFALNVHRSEVARRLARSDVAYPNSAFVVDLISRGVLQEITWNQARRGDIVIYFHDREPRHAGEIADGGVILSKWGSGNRYVHPLFEIPASYGEASRYFADIEGEAVCRALQEIADSR